MKTVACVIALAITALSGSALGQEGDQINKPLLKPWNAPTPPRPPGARPAGPNSLPPRPPLFFKEEWKRPEKSPTTAFFDPCCWAMSQDSVTSPNLELKVYGATKEISLVGTAGNENNPIHGFTGMCSTPCGIGFRDRQNYVDLSRGRIRWNAKTAGFHSVRPMIRLADGTYLIGDYDEGNGDEYRYTEFFLAQLRWLRMDEERVMGFGYWIAKPDLSKVDEVGWVDLLPGSGHNQGGYIDVAQMEVYGHPVPRQ